MFVPQKPSVNAVEMVSWYKCYKHHRKAYEGRVSHKMPVLFWGMFELGKPVLS